MKKVQDKEILDFFSSAFDAKEIFANENFLSDIYDKLYEFATYKKINMESMLVVIKELLHHSINITDNNKAKNVLKILEITLWPVFNDKNFKEKTFSDYNIDIKSFKRYIDDELSKIYYDSSQVKDVLEFQFENNKLKYIFYELDGGIIHIYENNKLKKIKFCDGSEIEVPENI